MENVNNIDLLALHSYVTAESNRSLPADVVLLDLTHSNLIQRHIEIKFSLHSTIESLRIIMHRQTGTPPSYQHLQIRRGGETYAEIAPGTQDGILLGYYSPCDGTEVHCIDLDPNSGSRGGGYENISLIEKYQMPEDVYDRREGTLRSWGRKQKEADPTFTLAKHAKEHQELVKAIKLSKMGMPLPKGFRIGQDGQSVVRVALTELEDDGDEKKSDEEEKGPDSVKGITVGDRCEIRPGGRRASVAFVGDVDEIGGGGSWVGVIFDEPVGKTDGTVKGGRRYFEAPGPKRGGFVRGMNVNVGNFPEKDIMDELDTDSEDEL